MTSSVCTSSSEITRIIGYDVYHDGVAAGRSVDGQATARDRFELCDVDVVAIGERGGELDADLVGHSFGAAVRNDN
jgi:hypothetical protein